MKYLDYPILTHLSDALSDLPTPEYKIMARVEAYSVKPIGKERKMFREMEEAYMSEKEEMDEMSFSPEMREAGLSSAFGRLDEKESRKVHFLIVSLLNTTFPDHDFSALRPDQFTREPSAAQVLTSVTSNFASYTGNTAPQVIASVAMSPAVRDTNLPGIHQTMSSSLSSSPSHSPPTSMANPDLYRLLSEILPLEETECEVYSWFPEPEYDPHLEAADNEMSEDEYEEELMVDEDRAEAMDLDDPSWGQAGMELDDAPRSTPMVKKNSDKGKLSPSAGYSSSSNDGWEKKKGGLLWSQNYFFYSRRFKRILFFSCWCRKRSSHLGSSVDDDSGAFPQAISSSFTPPTAFSGSAPPPRSSRHRYAGKPYRRSKPNLHKEPRGDLASTIPIRGMEQPRPSRLASSAPSTFIATPSPQVAQAALAKMSAGGFRPNKPTAKMMMSAVSASNKKATPDLVDLTATDRIRKERSESATPGPTNKLGIDGVPTSVDNSNNPKRVKA